MAEKEVKYQLFELYGGEVKIRFYPNLHQYKLDGERKSIPSPSKLANLYDPFDGKDWALGLARKEFAKYFEKQDADATFTQSELAPVIETALGEADRYTNETIDIGNEIHGLAQKFAQAIMAGDTPDVDALLKGIEEKFPPDEEVEEGQITRYEKVINGFKGFANWYATNDVKFVATEKLIYSRKYHIAGQTDLIAYVNGKLAIIDFKTGSLRSKQFFQISCYWQGYEEECEFHELEKPEVAYILNFNRDGVFVPPVEITREMHESLMPLIDAGTQILEKVKVLTEIMAKYSYK